MTTKSETGETFDPTKPFRTIDGREVREPRLQVVGKIESARMPGTWVDSCWYADGRNRFQQAHLDLVNIPEPPDVPSEDEVTRVEEAAADPENRFRGRHRSVPSEDGESDADFVERMAGKVSLGAFNLVEGERDRLIAIARRAVFPPDASALEIVCRAICKFEGRDPDLTGDSADAGAPKDQPRWRLEEGLAGAILTALHSGSLGSYAEPLWRGRGQGADAPELLASTRWLKPGDTIYVRAIVSDNIGERMPTNWPIEIVLDRGQSETIDSGGKVHYSALYAAPAQPDAYRAGLMRGAEIADRRALECHRQADNFRGGSNPQMEWLARAACHEGTAQDIRAEATVPPPDLTTPYTPRIVDLPDGTSELVLEDVPVYWRAVPEKRGMSSAIEEGFAADNGRFVGMRWPTRELPGEQSPKSSVGGDVGGAWRDCDCPGCVAKRQRAAAPPAPVPAGEVTERVWVFNDVSLKQLRRKKKLELYDWCTLVTHEENLGAALTAAQPRADAGEVTEEMVEAGLAKWAQVDGGMPPQRFSYPMYREILRAALAAREAKP